MSTNMAGIIQAQESVWVPPPTVTGHAGEPIPPESNFFVPPPEEIGVVKSAHTSFKKGGKPKSTSARLTLVGIWVGVGFVVAFVSMVMFTKPASLSDLLFGSWLLWGAILAAVFAPISWLMTRFKQKCSFVGTEGSVEITCKGTPENVTSVKSFLFKNAGAISTSVTRVTRNGRYNSTGYCYSWYPPDSEKASYQISGRHTADLGNPPPGDPFNFARAIENAWYGHLIPKADAELRQNGYLKFFMGNWRWARVGRGYLEIVDGAGKVSRCEAAEIATANLNAGWFTLKRKDSKSGFFGSTGIFQFEFGKMFNGRLFLIAFENLLGIKLS